MPTASARTNPEKDTPHVEVSQTQSHKRSPLAPILAAAPDETAPRASQSDLEFDHSFEGVDSQASPVEVRPPFGRPYEESIRGRSEGRPSFADPITPPVAARCDAAVSGS